MFLDRFHEDLDVRDLDLAKPLYQQRALLGGDPTGAAVGDPPRLVQRAEIAANGHISRLQGEANPGRFQGTPANLVGKWVIAEQSQVTRPAPRADARQDRDTCSLDAP